MSDLPSMLVAVFPNGRAEVIYPRTVHVIGDNLQSVAMQLLKRKQEAADQIKADILLERQRYGAGNRQSR